jgi:hypothetical protein
MMPRWAFPIWATLVARQMVFAHRPAVGRARLEQFNARRGRPLGDGSGASLALKASWPW